jgi:hypothetical protein
VLMFDLEFWLDSIGVGQMGLSFGVDIYSCQLMFVGVGIHFVGLGNKSSSSVFMFQLRGKYCFGKSRLGLCYGFSA